MTGIATFAEAPQLQTALMYEERGKVHLEGLQRPFEAYRLYCFNTAVWPVEVYFVDDPTKKHLATLLPELKCHTSFFIPLHFRTFGAGPGGHGPLEADTATAPCDGVASFQHLCVDDMYTGTLSVTDADSFEWSWSIFGPGKDGSIVCKYSREGQGGQGSLQRTGSLLQPMDLHSSM